MLLDTIQFYPTLMHCWKLDAIGTMSKAAVEQLSTSVTSLHLSRSRDNPDDVVVTIKMDDDAQGLISNAITSFISKPVIGYIRFKIGNDSSPSSYLNLIGCHLLSYDFELNYTESGIATHVLKYTVTSYNRTVD